MARTNSLTFLKPTGATKKSFSTKISDEVDQKWRALEARVQKEAPNLSLDRGAIVEQALEEAIEKVNRHLDSVSSKSTQSVAS